jgi:large repetitive protein
MSIRLVYVVALAACTLALAGDAGAFGVVPETLPVGLTGQSYGYQFKVHGGNPPYTYSAQPDVLPPGLSLSTSGWLAGVPLVAGSWKFYVEGSYTYDSSPPRYSQREFTLDVIAGLSIRNRSLPAATRSVAYKTKLTAGGGGTPAWSIYQGSLPPGVSLSPGGLISGLPTRAGIFTFTARVADDIRVANKTFSLKVIAAPVLVVSSLPPAVVGSPFRATVRVVGGLAPFAWAMRGRLLPRGVSISRGTLRGTPVASGEYSIDVVVRDAAGNVSTSRLRLVVMARLKIPVQELGTGEAGSPYSGRVQTRGGATPLRFRLAEGTLPVGLSLNTTTGVIAGRPRERGRYVFVVAVVDRIGGTYRRGFVLTIR